MRVAHTGRQPWFYYRSFSFDFGSEIPATYVLLNL
jgi:hypothetical protein